MTATELYNIIQLNIIANRNKKPVTITMPKNKKCKICNEIKRSIYFKINRKSRDGLETKCIKCKLLGVKL